MATYADVPQNVVSTSYTKVDVPSRVIVSEGPKFRKAVIALSVISVLLLCAVIGLAVALGIYVNKADESNALKITDAITVMRNEAITGIIRFAILPSGKLRMYGNITELTPGVHSIHVHELGISKPRGADGCNTAGDDFNPSGVKRPDGKPVGRIANIRVAEDKIGYLDVEDSLLTLSGKNTLLGRTLVVHSGEDDGTATDHGNAGRVDACGVIGYTEP
mmetsp:Transcript_29439/g.47541  ORF Transcript_29439/g.47541 Transcript_29439/m.47541 type:complete len:219 (+) Transcript_29439:239-895(+)|eukprot:CAMPEP_0184656066 /NCGR_PEP_ID=MMETSP0308-20130426/15484_1 /TAXON_ID=38269 /ORGANISM="Gloeochaete witrockiana, Strain SAG 46.84" /LENGTH=218 /DNA_ID=CAMNT_0027092985 /DNA_START=73 /DNA_END=729 /DNA_ORIENTATION=-